MGWRVSRPARFVQFRIEEMMMRGMSVAKDSRKNKMRHGRLPAPSKTDGVQCD
jgi:hypothetical protein